jgi:hypothetical protein
MVTLVSGLLPCLDRKRGESDWLHFAHLLRATGLPLVLYGEPHLIEKVDAGPQGAVGSAVLRPLEEDALRRGLWLHEELQALTQASGHDPDQGLARMARLRAMGWLHDESIFNPHGSQGFVWVDPLLLDEVQPAYLACRGPLSRIEPLLDPVLLLARGDCGDGQGFSDALFGGVADRLHTVNHIYWQAYAELISQRQLPSFALLMTMLWREFPGSFQRFNLQSNGLPGTFFEALRGAPVALETLHLSLLEP